MESKENNQNHDSGTVSRPPAAAAVVGMEEIFSGSPAPPPPPLPPAEGPVCAVSPGSDASKKKRGRPRKYGPDGKPTATLSPMPISASIPLTGDYVGWKHSQGKPLTSIKRKQKLEFCTPGERAPSSVCANFTPHVLTVNSGEDVNMKIISFAQQGGKAICVLSANGSISNVTLSQHNSSGGTLTYEGRFDILCLSGAFMSNDNDGAKGMSGGMSVSLAAPDGRVLGGGLSGMLVAAGSVQVILGSFLSSHQQEQQKPKKSRFEPGPAISPSNISFTLTNPIQNNGSLHA